MTGVECLGCRDILSDLEALGNRQCRLEGLRTPNLNQCQNYPGPLRVREPEAAQL